MNPLSMKETLEELEALLLFEHITYELSRLKGIPPEAIDKVVTYIHDEKLPEAKEDDRKAYLYVLRLFRAVRQVLVVLEESKQLSDELGLFKNE